LAIERLLILGAAAAAAACTYEGACSSQGRAGPGDARYQRDQGKQVDKRRIVGKTAMLRECSGQKGQGGHRRVRVGISSQPWEGCK
jgi:hypothetical protein